MSLIIIMGINWVFGVLLFHNYLLPLIYLFAISTALQVSSVYDYVGLNVYVITSYSNPLSSVVKF